MTESDCGRLFAMLSEYLDQELAPASCAEIEDHLRGCPECIQFVDSLKQSMRLCRQFGNLAPAAPPDPAALRDLRQAYERMLARRRKAQSGNSQN